MKKSAKFTLRICKVTDFGNQSFINQNIQLLT